MAGKVRALVLTVAVVAGWQGETCCLGQDLPPSPPAIIQSPGTGVVGVPPPAPYAPVPSAPPPPSVAPPQGLYEDNNGPLLRGDPLLDRAGYPPPGWFTAVEADLIKPHVKNVLTNQVNVDNLLTQQVSLPSTPLDWTGAFRLEVGYRFPEGFGEILLSYRNLTSEGSAILSNFDLLGDGFLRSRLDENVGDLDYSSREFSLAPDWDMKWKAGVRLAGVFFDSRAEGQFMEARTSNNFVGAGPHLGLDLRRCLGSPELALFGRLEGATLVGEIKQAFETTFVDASGTPFVGGAVNAEMTQAIPVLGGQFGVAWTPPLGDHGLVFVFGYEFEQWWYLGLVGDSRGELTVQGLFFRGEWRF